MVFSISHYRVRFEQRNNCAQNFRSAYLQTHTTICHDSSCNNTSIPCSILNLAWFGERKGSITYLILKQSEMPCWSWCCSPIQMSTMPCNDGSLRSFGSMVHGKPHSSNCHLRCFGKTGNDEGWTDDIWWFKRAHQGVFVEKQWRGFQGFECFSRILLFGEKSIESKRRNLVVWLLSLLARVLQMGRKLALYHLFNIT